MRTPTVMIIGMVLAPCGLVLNLTSLVSPDWRQQSQLNGYPTDVVLHQGLWDICREAAVSNSLQCGVTDSKYFENEAVKGARGLMPTSLAVTVLGIVLSSLGVRCWHDVPHFLMAGLGGLVLFFSGILSLVAVSWYNNTMYAMLSTSTGTISVGYSLVLGYLGSCLEIIGGFSLALSLVHCCQKCMENRRKPSALDKYYNKKASSMEKPNNPTSTYPSHVYSIRDHRSHADPYPPDMRYSVGNDNYRHASNSRYFTNPMDVTEGEHPRGRPGSQLSSLPCDSDLL
ncbi:claudin-23 [Discoglossus pictus]